MADLLTVCWGRLRECNVVDTPFLDRWNRCMVGQTRCICETPLRESSEKGGLPQHTRDTTKTKILQPLQTLFFLSVETK